MSSKKYYITPRIQKGDSRLLLFMYDGGQITCYDPHEGHSVADYGWYLKATRPARYWAANAKLYGVTHEAQALFDSYTADGFDGCTPVLSHRLLHNER